MKGEDWGLVLLLCAISFFLGVAAMGITDRHSLGIDAHNEIVKCEKSIPRNRHCVIVAKEIGQ